MMYRGVDHNGVLIVVNSASTLSRDVADMYRALRGIGPHEISMPMPLSSTMTWTQARNVVLAVNDYIRSHDISAVIVSADTPTGVVMPYVVKLGVSSISLDNLLSWAWYVVEYGLDTATERAVGFGAAMLDAPYRMSEMNEITHIIHKITRTKVPVDGYRDSGFGTQFQINGEWVSKSTLADDYYIPTNMPIAITPRPASHRLPYGRIGYGRRHTWLPPVTLASCQRMVEDAIAAEQSAITRTVHVAATMFTGAWPLYDDMAGGMLHDAGYIVRYLGSGVPGVTYDYAYPSPPASMRLLHGYLGLAPNLSTESAFNAAAGRFDYAAGSWVIGGLSFGLSEWGVRALVDGACSAVGTVYEPFSDALILPTWTAEQLLSGRSMAEIASVANYRSDYTWQMSAWGDPLYIPHPVYGLPDGELSTISVVTPDRSAALSTPDRAAALSSPDRAAVNITPSRSATWRS